MIPTYTSNGTTHWRKWPGRVACGGEAKGTLVHRAASEITCETCMQLVASWFVPTRFDLLAPAGLDLTLTGLEQTTFTSWAAAHQALMDARRRAFHLKKLNGGQIPKFRLVLNTDQVDQDRLARCVPIEPAELVGL